MAVNHNAAIQNLLMQIQQNLTGTIAQLDLMKRQIEEMSQGIMEHFYQLTENLRLILRVLKEQRVSFAESIQELTDSVNLSIKELFESEVLPKISEEQVQAALEVREMTKITSDNLYNMQLLTIIQDLRELIGRALVAKLRTERV
ncbi:MAG: hypothetical protein Kow0069_18820 [Promethearchaeota archaeon]